MGSRFVGSAALDGVLPVSPNCAQATRAHRSASGFLDGFRYVWRRPDLRAILVMLLLIGTFGFNFPVFISAMAVNITSTRMRVLSACSPPSWPWGHSRGRCLPPANKPGLASLSMGAGVFGLACILGAVAPGYSWDCGHSRGQRRGCHDFDQRHQQHHATLDRTLHAGQGNGASGRGGEGNDDRRSDRRLGCPPLRPALVARGGYQRRPLSPPWSQSTRWPAEKCQWLPSN